MMKRVLAALLALALLAGLSACAKPETERAQPERAALTVPGVDPASGAWIGQGGCYRLEPDEAEEDGILSFSHAGHSYILHDSYEGRRISRDGETIYETQNWVNGIRSTEKGIWVGEEVREEQGWSAHFVLLDGEGQEQYSLHIPLPGGSDPRSFSADEGLFYLNCTDALRVYDLQGEELAAIPHAEWAGRLLRGADGVLYYLEEGELGGGSVFAIDAEGAALRSLFDFPRGQLCKGDEAAPFLLILSEGLDRVQADGSAAPLVRWEECSLSVNGLLDVQAQDDGSYRLTGFAAPLRLVPAEPSELKARRKLTLGVLPMDTEGRQRDFAMANANLVREVAAFNAWSTDSYVQLLDLSEDGTLSAEQARLKLNTQLIAGEGPDMLLFDNWSLSPFPFVRKELLLDLGAFVAEDAQIAEEDIVIAPMLKNDLGGLYLLGSSFSIETRYGLQERFGEVWGWDYETYRRLDREAPAGSMVMYNLTREYFLREAASRFSRSAIDWQSGVCDFDNADFVRLLEACRDMRETPEDPENMVFGLPSQLMEGGYMLTSMTMIHSPESFAREQREMGKPLRYIGFPTPDGSCGTDLDFSDAIGVLRSSAHPEACWQFLKYSLTHSSADLPVYRPLLDERMLEAQREHSEEERDLFSEWLTPPVTDEEARGFYELLEQIEHTRFYDPSVLEIIQAEFAAVQAGSKTAQEAAKLIQSRISLYVAEQN